MFYTYIRTRTELSVPADPKWRLKSTIKVLNILSIPSTITTIILVILSYLSGITILSLTPIRRSHFRLTPRQNLLNGTLNSGSFIINNITTTGQITNTIRYIPLYAPVNTTELIIENTVPPPSRDINFHTSTINHRYHSLCQIPGSYHTTQTVSIAFNPIQSTVWNTKKESFISTNLLIFRPFLHWKTKTIMAPKTNTLEPKLGFGFLPTPSQYHILKDDSPTITTKKNISLLGHNRTTTIYKMINSNKKPNTPKNKNNKNTNSLTNKNKNNNKKEKTITTTKDNKENNDQDTDMKDQHENEEFNSAPGLEDMFPEPDQPSKTTQILPCGERPQIELTLHLSTKVNPNICNITETEVSIANAFVALDRDFQIMPFLDDTLNPLTQHQKITANKDTLDSYFFQPTMKHHKKFSTLHMLFKVKSRDNINQWRKNSHFLNWLKANQVWIRQTVIMESRVTNIGWFQHLHPDSTHFQTLRDIFTVELNDKGYDFAFELAKASPFQPKDEDNQTASTRAIKLVVATKDIEVATEAFITLFSIGFAGYKQRFLKEVNFIPYGRHPNMTREDRVKAIHIQNSFLNETAFFFIKNLSTIEEKVKYVAGDGTEKKGTFHSYIIREMQAIDISPTNGKNRWVVTCPKDSLQDMETQFDNFMEDISTYMGVDVLGDLIGVKDGVRLDLPTREKRHFFQDNQVDYLKKIGMYSDTPAASESYPTQQKRRNTQFVYTPKSTNKVWSKLLFPAQQQTTTHTNTSFANGKRGATQTPSVNATPTLAPSTDDTSSLTTTWASEFDSYKEMMNKERASLVSDLNSVKTAQNTFMQDVAEFRREQQAERKERQEERQSIKELLNDIKQDKLDQNKDNFKFKQEMTTLFKEQHQTTQKQFEEFQKEQTRAFNNLKSDLLSTNKLGDTSKTPGETSNPIGVTSTILSTPTHNPNTHITITPDTQQTLTTPQSQHHTQQSYISSTGTYIDTEAEGRDESAAESSGDTSTLPTPTLTSLQQQCATNTENKNKRKVENDSMDTSDGQSSIEVSRLPQGSSPDEGSHF